MREKITLGLLRGRSDAAVDGIVRSLDRYSGEPEFELFAADALLFLGELEAARATLLTRMEEHVARERARVEAEGIAAPVDSMIAAGLKQVR